MKRALTVAVVGAVTALAPAQTNVDATNKHAWGENVGWSNWRDAGSPAGAQGARVDATFLSGFVWSENVGFINVGDGTPASGGVYANVSGADFGVNRDPETGNLSGLAWGENVGWINFAGGSLTSPPNAARIESVDGVCRLAGFVWGENVGWISLDDGTHFVAVPNACENPCDLAADLDSDEDVDLQDLATLLAHFGMANGATFEDGDVDGDSDVELADLAILLSQFGTNCP